jgi:hypothetical protein
MLPGIGGIFMILFDFFRGMAVAKKIQQNHKFTASNPYCHPLYD